MSIEEVKPKTPIIDLVETIPKIGKPIANALRAVRPWWRRRHEKRVQDYVDRTYHDKLRNGLPERDDVP
jgi:hypothetical protein